MTAEIRPRINFEDRTHLETVIPLSTPYLVFLDPSDICNFQCAFCPTGDKALMLRTRKQQFMGWDLYKKVINDLCQMPNRVKTLRLYGFGEPLLNPRFVNMVDYAKSANRFLQIDTTTNGSLLTPELSEWIVKAGLNTLIVSVPTNYSDEYREGIAHFYQHSRGRCEVYVKAIREGIEGKAAKFLKDFKDISDRLFIENQVNCWPNFDAGPDGVRGIYDQELKDPAVCPYIFYSLTINSDGTVSACFLDWDRSMVIGDLVTQSFDSIWNGPELRKMRLTHLLQHKRFYGSCASCKQLQYGACDDIDRYVEAIWKRV